MRCKYSSAGYPCPHGCDPPNRLFVCHKFRRGTCLPVRGRLRCKYSHVAPPQGPSASSDALPDVGAEQEARRRQRKRRFDVLVSPVPRAVQEALVRFGFKDEPHHLINLPRIIIAFQNIMKVVCPHEGGERAVSGLARQVLADRVPLLEHFC